MPEFAIAMTVLLVGAPVVLAVGSIWMATNKPFFNRQPENHYRGL